MALVIVQGLARELLDVLLPYKGLIVPLFWFAFVGSAILAVFLYRHRFARRTFVTAFIIGLLFFNTLAPVALLPYVDWHKFSSPRPEVIERTDMRLVDENGNETDYPREATLGVDNVQMSVLKHRIVEGDFSARKTEAIVRHLVMEAEEYRERKRNPSPLRYLRYPDHGLEAHDPISSHDPDARFIGIRIYNETIVTSPDGTEIIGYEQELAVEIVPEEGSSGRTTSSSTTTGESTYSRPAVAGTGGTR